MDLVIKDADASSSSSFRKLLLVMVGGAEEAGRVVRLNLAWCRNIHI
jgi:hypothetical protein